MDRTQPASPERRAAKRPREPAAAVGKTSNIALRRLQARQSGDKEYQARREQLLRAAADVFRQMGLKGASIHHIARAVGIDRASIYYYTSGKEELFHEVVRMATLGNIEMAEAIHTGDLPSREKIEQFVVTLMKSYEDHFPYLHVYVQEDMARIAGSQTAWAKDMGKLAKRFDHAVVGIVQAGIDDGTLRSDVGDAQVIAFGIIGMCNWSHRWYKPAGRHSAAAIGKSFARLVLDGIAR